MTSRFDRGLDGTIRVSLWTVALSAPHSGFLLEAAVLLASIAWLIRGMRGRNRPARLPLLWPILIFHGLSVVSALAAESPLFAFSELKSAWAYPIFFWLCVNPRKEELASLRLRLVAFVISAGAAAAVGIGQVAVYGSTFRAQGTHSTWMTYSEILGMAILVALALLLIDPPRQRRWLAGAILLMVVAVVLSQTRGAWVGLVIGALPVLWLWRRWSMVLAPLVAVLVLIVAPPAVKQRLDGLLDLTDITVGERFVIWSAGAAMVRAHPILGVGPNYPGELFEAYHDPAMTLPPKDNRTHMHSNVVQIAAERGLPALVAWLAIWVAFVLAAVVAVRGVPRGSPGSALVAAGAGSVALFLAAGMTEYTYGDNEVLYTISFLASLPYVAAAYNRRRNRSAPEARERERE